MVRAAIGDDDEVQLTERPAAGVREAEQVFALGSRADSCSDGRAGQNLYDVGQFSGVTRVLPSAPAFAECR